MAASSHDRYCRLDHCGELLLIPTSTTVGGWSTWLNLNRRHYLKPQMTRC